MNIDLGGEALEYGALVRKALGSAGGDDLLRISEKEPHRRNDIVATVLAELGAWELDPRGNRDELEAAAALCRSVGYWSIAYPVAERLCRPTDLDVDGMVVVAAKGPAAAIAGLDLRWAAVTIDGQRSLAGVTSLAGSPHASVVVANLELEPHDLVGAEEVALGLVLPCWTLLGMLDRAMELTRTHVLGRQQFGQPLAAFQGVQFQLTDAEVERAGVEELGKYALWSIESGQPAALDDALAFRLVAVEAADTVFRVAHQLHGATGFCDETTLSWVSRHSFPLRRLPFGVSGTLEQLGRRLGRGGLSGPFRGQYGG